jgi:hypothetical protein
MTEPDNFMAKPVWEILDRVESASRKLLNPYDWNRVYRSIVLPIGFDGVTGTAWEDIWERVNGD